MIYVADELAYEALPEETKQLIVALWGEMPVPQELRHKYHEGYSDGFEAGKQEATMGLNKRALDLVMQELEMIARAYIVGAWKADMVLPQYMEFLNFVHEYHPEIEPYLTEDIYKQWITSYAKS